MSGIFFVSGFLIVDFMVARSAQRNQPIDGLFADVSFGIPRVVHLCGRPAALHASPIVTFQHNISLALPCFRFEVNVAVISPPR